jgi:hypothetical protein
MSDLSLFPIFSSEFSTRVNGFIAPAGKTGESGLRPGLFCSFGM